jgi:hypothetical protein
VAGQNPIPSVPLTLGLLGLIPFACSIVLILADNALLSRIGLTSFVIYAAAILSFLGGVRWGLEMARDSDRPDTLRLIFSVLPSIGGWALAVWALEGPAQHGTASIFAGLFAAQYVWDRASGPDGLSPPWYPLLRQVLTGGVMLACLALPLAGLIGRV